MDIWRKLSPEETKEFRQWARDNFKPETGTIDDLWHPVVRDECNRMIAESKQHRPIYQIASEICKDWKNPYFGAKPYIEAMGGLNTVNDVYGWDSAKSIIMYFLSNAQSWRGEKARSIKAELKRMIK